jgi:hypothetical protein
VCGLATGHSELTSAFRESFGKRNTSIPRKAGGRLFTVSDCSGRPFFGAIRALWKRCPNNVEPPPDQAIHLWGEGVVGRRRVVGNAGCLLCRVRMTSPASMP